MTKIHETFYRSEVENMQLFKSPLKGEITVVISKKTFDFAWIADSPNLDWMRKKLDHRLKISSPSFYIK